MESFDAEKNARLLARAAEEASDFILITDFTPPSRGGPFIRYANDSLLQATGFAMSELLGRPYHELLHQQNDPLTLKSMAKNLEECKTNEKEMRLRRKDGSGFWVEVTGKPLSDGGEKYWVAIGRDISLRRRAQEQMTTLMTAIDAVSGHLEIYALENGEYSAIFQNAEADTDISALVETLLNEPAIREATALRARLSAGESVTVTSDGLQIRPLDKNAETLICIKQKAS